MCSYEKKFTMSSFTSIFKGINCIFLFFFLAQNEIAVCDYTQTQHKRCFFFFKKKKVPN